MLSALLAVQGTCLSPSFYLSASFPPSLPYLYEQRQSCPDYITGIPLPCSCGPVDGNAQRGSHYGVVRQGLKCIMIIHVLSGTVCPSYESHQAGACHYISIVLSFCMKCCVFGIMLDSSTAKRI